MPNTYLRVIAATSILAAASCSDKTQTGSDGGPLLSDVILTPDASLVGVRVDHTEHPRTLDEGFHLGTTVPILTMHFWERDDGCAEVRTGTNLGDVVELSIFVGGAGDVAPLAGMYPISPQVDPGAITVEADSAAIQANAAPVGTVRAESGIVIIESIDENEVTFVVDAVLEGGTPVRGRMTVGRECR